MKVMKVGNTVQKVNALQLAKTINNTKTLPPEITKDYANTVLKNKGKKLTIATLAGVTGIISSFFLLDKSIDVQNVFEGVAGSVLLVSSWVYATIKSCKNKIIDKAQDILDFRNNK